MRPRAGGGVAEAAEGRECPEDERRNGGGERHSRPGPLPSRRLGENASRETLHELLSWLDALTSQRRIEFRAHSL